jgi:putative ABC transport system permease protein
MLKNYIIIAWRNLMRHKTYSLINIAGLSIGLASAMLILLYVKDEVSYDKFHSNVDNVYRIVTKSKYEGVERKGGNTGYLQGPRFAKNVPGIEHFVRLQGGSEDFKKGSEIFSQELLYVDPDFFSVFSFPLIGGNPDNCLNQPNSVVVSEKFAKNYFGTTQALGKTLQIKENNQFVPYIVSAVTEKCPQNSSIQFDVLLPFKESQADATNNDNWYNYFLNTFVVLNPKASKLTVEKQMQEFYIKDASSTFKNMIEKYGGGPEIGMGSYFLQPFTEMHLSTDLPPQNGLVNASNPTYSYILSGIAIFVLLIACINFVNLTIARSLKRAREIGIRKVVGSNRKQLIIQFIGESFMLSLIAFAFGLLLVKLALPVFNHLANKSLALSYLFDTRLVITYILLLLLTGLLAGFYPALVLSGFNPVSTLYSRFRYSGRNYTQKSLVVLQFALASFLIIATFTIYRQFNFLTQTDLGYDDSNIAIVNAYCNHSNAAVFKAELLKNPNITSVAAKNAGSWFTNARLSNDSMMQFSYETVDENYLTTMKIPLVTGRNFSPQYPSDSNNSVIVNEAFVKKAGWKNPIGETVNFFYNDNEIYKVIGVVKDYHYATLNQKIDPQLFTMKNSNWFGLFNIKIKPGSETASLKYIQTTFRQIFPLNPYSYIFMDDQRKLDYEAESKWKQIMFFGALLTIFISCIGLFGLSVLSAEKRTREIGIRKVLGASVNNVVTILSRDFLLLVSLSLVISTPLAWLAANKWLQNYQYRISLDWWLFAMAGILVVLVAILTVSFQAIKAAVANPVKSLRTE